MSIYTLNGEGFKRMLVGGVNLMARLKSEIDALNVFPVPDGDTGTNMYLTYLAAAKEANKIESNHLGEVVDVAARGCLMGARGNSGVILSQFVRGFANSLNGKPAASAQDIALAFEEGARLAYQAVAEPVEGTVLTVMGKTAETARQAAGRSSDLLRFMIMVLRQASKALEETPEQLPVLKEAGVVDAGGKGLVVILQGIMYALRKTEDIELLEDFAATQKKRIAELNIKEIDSDIRFTYCTEFLLKSNNLPLEKIKSELKPYGDCLMVVGNTQVAKVHIHSNHPGLVLETCLNYGTMHDIQINNMRQQNQDLKEPAPKKSLAVVAVAAGEGIVKIMESLGVDTAVTGGQTMNPSTEDILQAIESAPADNVIILPNNKNIIMAAEQAASMTEKTVWVIPSKSVPQGLAALLAFDAESDLKENAAKMNEAITAVRTGEVTKAVRDVSINDQNIVTGDYLGIADGEIVTSGSNLSETVRQLVKNLITDGEEIVTLYYGEELNEEYAQETANRLQNEFADLEVEVHYGGQPLYQFIISAE